MRSEVTLPSEREREREREREGERETLTLLTERGMHKPRNNPGLNTYCIHVAEGAPAPICTVIPWKSSQEGYMPSLISADGPPWSDTGPG